MRRLRLFVLLTLLAPASVLSGADRRDVEAWSPGAADITGWPAKPPVETPAPPEAPRTEAAEAPPANGPAVSLVWFDPQEALPAGFDAMQQEVESIFRGMGVHVTWTRGGLGTSFGEGKVPEVPEIPVILLPGDPVKTRRERRVMGLVIRDQEPNRAIWLFLDNVRWTLGQSASRGKALSNGEAGELGRALARVVAHEVVHAITPDEPHAQAGLMHHSMNRAFLVGRRAAIDPRCAAAFLTGLAALLPPMAPPPPTAALRTAPVGAP
jgi:hypothetical protein